MNEHEEINIAESDNKNKLKDIVNSPESKLGIKNDDSLNNLSLLDQKLEKAFDKIEAYLDEELNLQKSLSEKNNMNEILVNLDILITRVKDILLQVE